MHTFLVERTIPAAFHVEDPENVALHARWAVEAYRDVGALWLGGVVTEDRMWSLVAAEANDDLRRYCASLGIADEDVRVRRVVRPIGPYFAAPRATARPFRAPR